MTPTYTPRHRAPRFRDYLWARLTRPAWLWGVES